MNDLSQEGHCADRATDHDFGGDAPAKARAELARAMGIANEPGILIPRNLEMVIEARRRAERAVAEIGQSIVAFQVQQYERGREAFEQLASVRSPTDLLRLQSQYVESAIDSAISQGSKIGEAWIKAITESIELTGTRRQP